MLEVKAFVRQKSHNSKFKGHEVSELTSYLPINQLQDSNFLEIRRYCNLLNFFDP